MAKALIPSLDADRVNSPAPSAPDAPAVNAAAPATPATPDNTPLPGGGRWRWDSACACWTDTPAPLHSPILE